MTSLSQRLQAVRSGDILPQEVPVAGPEGEHETPEEQAATAAESAAATDVRLAEGLQAVKARAVETLFDRIGARINDPTLTEEQLHDFVRDELSRIVDEEPLLADDG